MKNLIGKETADLLILIGEKQETIREGKPFKNVHLNAHERGIIAPRIERRYRSGGKTEYQVLGLVIRPGDGGVFISG